jgi:hypothetical protein
MKFFRALGLVVGACVVAGVLCATTQADESHHERTTTQETSRRPVACFIGDFERGDFSGWGAREAAREDSLQVVSTPARCGRYAARFTVRPGEIVSNGNRAEICRDNRDFPGSEGWYAWSFLIPVDFPDTQWRPKLWQCIGQWHDQPNIERGETWDDFPGHSPSIAVYYTCKEGTSAIELWYGTYGKGEIQKVAAVAPIEKGRWMDLVFHIGWSHKEDGFLEAWLNEKPLIAPDQTEHKLFGANMWNDYPHYLKIGLYRSGEFTTTSSVYFDEVRIGNNYKEVSPAR